MADSFIAFFKPDNPSAVSHVVKLKGGANMPVGAALLSGWAGFPPNPGYDGAELRCENGTLYWHDPRPLEDIKAAKWVEIKTRREDLDNQPIACSDFEVDASASSRIDLMGAIMSMQITGMASRDWRCADNVMRTLTLAEIVGVGTGIAARRQVLIETSDALYKAIQAATTTDQVAAITWPA